MQNNTELLCLILEFQSRSLIVQGLLQAEAAKEYKADWLKNADTVVRDRGGKFAKKGTSIAQPIQDATAILKQGFDLMGDTIQSLVKDPEFRKRAGLAAGLPMAKLISNLATQARLNPKLTEKLDEWIANATKEFADQYGDDKSPMAQAIRNNKLAQPPKDASFNEKMEFRVAQYAAYKEALDSPEDFSKRDELISKAATAAIPIGVSLAIALGFEVAIPLFLAQSVNWATVLSSVAIGEAADFAVQKGMDKLEINNPALRIGASMVAGILAGGLVTGVNNKIAFNKLREKSVESLGKPKLSFFAQNLDNKSRDHLRYKGDDGLTPDQRAREVFRISEMRSRGKEKRIKDINNLDIRLIDKEFTLEITPNELDEGGRFAPIVVNGDLPKGLNPEQMEQWADETIQEIEQFATDIGRTFNSQTLKDLRTWFTGKEQVESLVEKEARELAERDAQELIERQANETGEGWLTRVTREISPQLYKNHEVLEAKLLGMDKLFTKSLTTDQFLEEMSNVVESFDVTLMFKGIEVPNNYFALVLHGRGMYKEALNKLAELESSLDGFIQGGLKEKEATPESIEYIRSQLLLKIKSTKEKIISELKQREISDEDLYKSFS